MLECEFICTDLDIEALHQFDQPNLTKIMMSATDFIYWIRFVVYEEQYSKFTF